MLAAKVRSDYESLSQIAKQFDSQSEATLQMLQQMKREMAVLQSGDWVGKGAEKFYREMSASVLPSLTRLQGALKSASRTTTQISRIMKQAEEESARLFRVGDNGVRAWSVDIPGSASGGTAGKPGAAVWQNASSQSEQVSRFSETDASKTASGPSPRGRQIVENLITAEQYQDAIDAAIRLYNVDISSVTIGPVYNKDLPEGEARTLVDGTVEIGPRAFWSSNPAALLASTLIHESVHARQISDGHKLDGPQKHILEVEAYDAELANAAKTGLNADQRIAVFNRRNNEYNNFVASFFGAKPVADE